MPAGKLSIGNRSSQVWNASGEATEQTRLPQEFVSNPVPASPLTTGMQLPTDHTSFVPGQPNAVVRRWPRMNGMRYLYAHGTVKQPVNRNGTNIPKVWSSNFQPWLHGPIHDAGFNDALFQAGYPGFNLALSFKVPSVVRLPVLQPLGRNNPQRFVATQPESVAPNILRRRSRWTERKTVSAGD